MDSGIIHILTIESHDVVEHVLSLNSGTVGIELNGTDVAVDGFVPLGLLAIGVALFVKSLSLEL